MEGEEKSFTLNEDFVCKKHVKFFKRCLDTLPSAYASLDTSRFVDLLNRMYLFFNEQLQVLKHKNNKIETSAL